MQYRRSPHSIVLTLAVAALLWGLFGCAQPSPAGDDAEDQLTTREIQQRQRLIEPLEGVPEQRQGQQAPTLVEFYVDEQGRIQVDILPYLLDPGPEQPADPEEIEDLPGPEPPDPPAPAPDQ